MASKGITGIVIALVLLAIAYFGGITGAVVSAIVLVVFMLPNVKFDGKPSATISLVALLLIVVTSGIIPAVWGSANTASIPNAAIPTISEQPIATGGLASATLKLNVRNLTGGTYAGSGIVYALKPGVVSDRYSFMKLIAEGKTADLAPNSMTLTSGVFSLNGFAGKVGDTVTFAGYLDATPAAAEEKAFVMTATLTGLTAGSTPEWMISTPTYVWYELPTLLYYNYADTAVTVYTEDENSAIEKTITFSMFPTNNGEQWVDAVLWVESPASNIGAIKSVTITPETGSAVTYTGIPQEVTTSENLYRAVPALTTSTNKMYKVGAFPTDGLVRTSTSMKGKQTITVVYDHPASGSVNFYFKTTQNSNALTSSGGHYDSPSGNFNLNATADGTDGWT